MSSGAILHMVGVSKAYGSAADPTSVLRDVNLTIERGQKASLIGPSGSGKSTLMSLIAGLLRPTAGTVEIDGVPLSGLDDATRARLRASTIGIALQSDNLIPFLTARENIELAMAFVPGGARRSSATRAQELLDRFGVGDRAQHRPRQLSGGEAQRVALAVAMANGPALLLADEVVGQLDRETAGSVVDDVLATGFAVLFVTHDMGLADLADHRYAIEDGRICAR